MRRFLVLLMAFAIAGTIMHAQEAVYITAFQQNVHFDVPDTTQWMVVRDELDTTMQKRLLMFTHTPIKDSKGRMVSPVMAMIIEPVQDSADLIMYSVQKRTAVAYKVTKVLPSTSPMFSYRNTVGYEATYTSEKVPHSIYVAHMIFRNIGIEIICDSTTELIPKVKTDFQSFLQSITFNEDEE